MENNPWGLGQSFFNNLFGVISRNAGISISGANADFAPLNDAGGFLKLTGQDSVAWLGMRNKLMQKYAYDFCFPVSSVVDKLAEYDIAGKLEINYLSGKGKGNDAKNSWSDQMRLRLAKPNPLQTWEQFRGQQIVYKKVFGFCPVLPVIPAGFEDEPWMCTAIINLPPWLFQPIRSTRHNFIGSDLTDYVSGWRLNVLGQQIVLAPEDIFILEDGFQLDEQMFYILPQSRLVGLDMAISNLCAGMEADNVLLRKRGPVGFISHDTGTKDNMGGYIPMTRGEKKRLQTDLSNYGITWNQFQYVISRTAVKWVSTGFNVSELGTKDTIIKAEKAVCHRYNFPYTLYEEQDATYANGANAKKSVFQDNVIPNADKDFNQYDKFFKAAENNCELCYDFSHVAAFQEDEKFKGQAAQLLDQALQIEWLNNVITLNQWRTQRGYETTSDGDVYFKDLGIAVPASAGQIQPTDTPTNVK